MRYNFTETENLPRRKKANYVLGVVITFVISLFAAMLLSEEAALKSGLLYLVLLFFIFSILSFTFFLVKLLFHSQAKDENDEFHLMEIPKDQQELRNSH